MAKSKTYQNGGKATAKKAPKRAENPIFGYVTTEANAYRTRGVPMTDNWEWSMYEHIKRSFSYKHSKFADGENDGERPFKQIIRPILNVAYRAEGFDVKNIVPFVTDEKDYDLSFFVKKFHDKWALQKNIDTFIDSLVESYVDYGLTIPKRVQGRDPEIVPLQRIEFCDQTDFLAGDKGEVHSMSISEINEMRGKWDDDAIDVAIDKARNGKMVMLANNLEAKTPGKYIEVHEVHGTFPETWLNDYGGSSYEANDTDDNAANDSAAGENGDTYTDESNYIKQIHLIAYYYDDDNNQCGIHFFKGPERKQVYKALKRDPIFSRACGYGGIEELFEPQQWTNYSEIQLKEMLDVAALLLIQVEEGSGKTTNIFSDLEKGQVLEHDQGKPYSQLSLTPQNIERFRENIERWQANAQNIGSANEALLGQAPAAGTPFSLQALVVQQGFGLHDWRKGQLATFMGELYRDWFLEDLVHDMKTGHKWLDSLSLKEMQSLVENVVKNVTWAKQKELLLKGQMMSDAQLLAYQQAVRDGFMSGSKKFIEVMEQEMNDIPVDVEMNIANKQFDLQDQAQALTNVFRQIVANPQIFQIPGMGDLFNEIIESSGFSPVDFGAITAPQAIAGAATPGVNPAQPAQPQPSPVQLPSNQPQPIAQ